MNEAFRIGSRTIGEGHPTYFIAELSANHAQKLENAIALVEAAKAAGADAIKLQTYTPDTITFESQKEYFLLPDGRGGTTTLHAFYASTYTPWEWHTILQERAHHLGMELLSSAFDHTAAAFLESINIPAHKIASPELVDLPLIRRLASSGLPLIMSTGMATLGEIEEAVCTARMEGAGQIALLKCNSGYPASLDEMHLRTIPNLSENFQVPVGLSDHSLHPMAPVAAVTLGACIIEKHLTISRSAGGPDAPFSLEPMEFRTMVDAVRSIERALGRVQYGPQPGECKTLRYRRSLFVVRDLRAGELITDQHVRSIRPAHGLHPRHLPEIMGKPICCDVTAGEPLQWKHVRL
jgi:pseudaminic acid synthase